MNQKEGKGADGDGWLEVRIVWLGEKELGIRVDEGRQNLVKHTIPWRRLGSLW
jgi:hypothetical protein